jgi:hypothetical protein
MRHAVFTLLCTLVCGAITLFAQPVLNGTIASGEYQQTFNAANPASNNGFGGSSDIRALHIATDANNLYVALTAKVEANGNPIGIWLGFNQLTGRAANTRLSVAGAASYMEDRGANSDYRAGFEVDYMFSIQADGSRPVNVTRLVGGPTFQLVCNANAGGALTSSVSGAVFPTAGSVEVAFNNQEGNDLTVNTTGFEMKIPFSALGVTSAGNVQAFAFIAGNFDPFFSNITVPGNAGSLNLGFNPNFSTLAGGPYFTSAIALPVELTSFSGQVIGSGVRLTWTTASEQNNSGFEVQRAITQDVWTPLGFVPGAGTTTEAQSYAFTDAQAAGTVRYRLKQIDFDGQFEYSNIIEVNTGLPTEENSNLPKQFALSQNYPNPFNPTTIIAYQLPVAGNVSLKIFDMLGKEVATLVNGRQDAGAYTVDFNASQLSSGVYFYRLQSGSFVQTRKMMLVK